MRTPKQRIAIAASLLTLLIALPFFAQSTQNQKDEVALRAAIEKETVKGDLKGAIEQYKKLEKSKDRAIAARALIRMAESYEKQGNAEAEKLYLRIVQDYGDQKDPSALAQARLGRTSKDRTKGDRVVWTGPNVDLYGRVSSDGRFISYVDWNDGRLMIRDIVANVSHALTAAAPNYSQQAEWSAISKDGKQIVYDWLGGENGSEFRIAEIQLGRLLKPRRLNPGYFSPFDWSPDGKSIAAVTRNADRTTVIGLITVADGSFRPLRSVDSSVFATTNNRTSIRFSPNGKYIAYDRRATGASPQRDIFVVSTDGSEVPVVVRSANDKVMGWSPDGTMLLFSSDWTDSVELWGVRFADGKVQGPPEQLKAGIGTTFSLGTTDSGALYVYRTQTARDVTIAPIDLEAGRLVGSPINFPQGFLQGASNAFWSPDSKYLAYTVTCNNGCIAIRSVATGQVRRLAPTLASAGAPFWSPDGLSLLTRATDIQGRVGIFRIDVQSGNATAVYLSGGLGVLAEWSRDAKKVYFNRSGVLLERDLASGVEREIDRELNLRTGNISPDGQYFVGARTDTSAKTSSLILVPIAGGPLRELVRLTQPEAIALGGSWTPAGDVIFTKDTGSRKEVWIAPVRGGQPRKLDIDPAIWWDGSGGAGDQAFRVSPDGRNIAFVMGKSTTEVWAMENFLPATAPKR